jgi:hypothetical protein
MPPSAVVPPSGQSHYFAPKIIRVVRSSDEAVRLRNLRHKGRYPGGARDGDFVVRQGSVTVVIYGEQVSARRSAGFAIFTMEKCATASIRTS